MCECYFNCLLEYLTYYLPNLDVSIMKKISLLLLSLFIISCETTSLDKKPEIIPEPKKEIIYEPEEEIITTNEEPEIDFKDFSGIEGFQSKKLTSLVSEYGDLNFSKYEKYYEFHRYNAENCRIFVQNNASDKKIIHITIFNFEKNKFYKKYSRDACQ